MILKLLTHIFTHHCLDFHLVPQPIINAMIATLGGIQLTLFDCFKGTDEASANAPGLQFVD